MLKKRRILPDMVIFLFKRRYHNIILLYIIIALLASFFVYSHTTKSPSMTTQRRKRDLSIACPHPCERCPPLLFKHTNKRLGTSYCRTECLPNYHSITSDAEGNSCVRCDDRNCEECRGSPSRCSSCIGGYFLHQGNCFQHCPYSLFHHNSECHDECPAGLFHHNTNCVRECPYSLLLHQRNCVEQCPINMLRHNRICVHSCPEGFKENKKITKCVPRRGKCKPKYSECFCHKQKWIKILKKISRRCKGKKYKKYRRCRRRFDEPCRDTSRPILSNSRPDDKLRRILSSESQTLNANACKNCRFRGRHSPPNPPLMSYPAT